MLGLSGRAAGPGLPMHLPGDVTSSAGWRRVGRGCEHSSSGPHPASRSRGPMGAKAPKGRIGSRRSTRREHARESTEPDESGASTAAEPTEVRDSRTGEQGRRERHLALPAGSESTPPAAVPSPPFQSEGRSRLSRRHRRGSRGTMRSLRCARERCEPRSPAALLAPSMPGKSGRESNSQGPRVRTRRGHPKRLRLSAGNPPFSSVNVSRWSD